MDGNSELLRVGEEKLQQEGLTDKKAVLKSSWEFEFDCFGQPHFDVIFSQGVICHMPNEEIKRMFKNVSSVLHPEGSAHVSYIEGTKKDEYEGVFQQTFEELRDIGSKFGLKAVDSGDWNHPRNLKMITLTF